MMDHIDFGNFLTERIREKNVSLKHLSEASGIPFKHLENLASGKPELLPPAPYVRGYILKLGHLLDFDGNFWWESFRKEKITKSSGESDRPSKNRFVKSAIGWYFLSPLILVVLVYFGYNIYRMSARPRITISAPAENPAVTAQNNAVLAGQMSGGSHLFINEKEVMPDKNGYFQTDIQLQPGINSVEIKAQKFLGGETDITRQIIYQPASLATSTPINSSTTQYFDKSANPR